MTITLPAEPATVPTLDVDPAAIDDCGADLLAASAQIDDTGSFVAGTARIPAWTGQAGTAYAATVAPLGHRADAMSLALRGVATRVDEHGDRMRALQLRREDLLSRRSSLVADIAELRAEIAAASAEDEPRLQAEADAVASRVSALDADVDTWGADVHREEQEMSAAFRAVLDLDQVEQRYGGVSDPADAALASKPPAGAPPSEVLAWWNGLTSEQQQAIMAASPGSIGNLDGIPAVARDQANTVSLDRDLADWGNLERQGLLTDDEKRWLENARAAQAAMEAIGDRNDPVTAQPIQSQLFIYDPQAFGGDGRVAIASGDLDTADNVAVLTPGFGTDATSIGTQSGRATTIYEAARNLDPTETNATLAFIGYDAPDNAPWDEGWDGAGVVGESMAKAGGERLADTIDGLRASRPDDPAHLTAIGHSYGSTTVAHGAHDHGLAVDDIVLTGSPGAGGDAEHASDLNLDPSHVWAGENSHDLIADLGNHGSVHLETLGGGGLGDDPAEDDFGAQRFQAESTTRGDGANPFNDHSKYFEHDTESLHNVASIVNGDYDDVTRADPIHDPWYRPPVDPEYDRTPTAPDTDGRP